MKDASLDEFLDDASANESDDPDDDRVESDDSGGAPSESDDAAHDERAEDDVETTTGSSDSEPSNGTDDPSRTVDGATATMRFDPDGAPCAGCGIEVGRRWQTEDGLRCENCVSW